MPGDKGDGPMRNKVSTLGVSLWEKDGPDREGTRGLTAAAACQAEDTALPTLSTCLHLS